jgi:hypothetical protein
VIPTDGDLIVRQTIGYTRRMAHGWRLAGSDPGALGAWYRGAAHSAIIIAVLYLEAEPCEAMAAQNEVRYLLGDYLRRNVPRETSEAR